MEKEEEEEFLKLEMSLFFFSLPMSQLFMYIQMNIN